MLNEKITYDQEEYLLILKHLHVLQERLETVIQENIELKELLENYYGHKFKKVIELNSDNFKEQPSYVLGQNIIEGSKSVSGILTLPQKVYNFYKIKNNKELVYIKTRKKSEIKKIDKLENHLSYRIGSVIENNIKSKKGIIKIPYLIAVQIKEYNSNK